MKYSTLSATILVLLAQGANAYECADLDAWTLDFVLNAGDFDELTSQTRKSVDDALDKALVSTPSISGATAAAQTDFYKLLSISGLSDSVFGDNVGVSDDDLTFKYNLKTGTGAIQVSASLPRSPMVNPSLTAAVAEDLQSEFGEEINDRLGLGDESTFSIAFNAGGDHFGRGALGKLDRIFSAATQAVSSAEYSAAAKPILDIYASQQTLAPDDTFEDIRSLITPAEYQVLCDKAPVLRDIVRGMNMAETAKLDELKFQQLVENAPQLHVGLDISEKEDFVGPDSVSAKITYEFPLRVSLSDMLESGDFNSYVVRNAAAIEAADRMKVSLEYEDIDDYRVTNLPGNAIFEANGGRKIIASVAYGRRLSTDGPRQSRFDAELRYEDSDMDDMINDRAIASFTYSLQLSDDGQWTLPITLLYSNREEFVSETSDTEITAHVGIKWELPE